MKLTSRVVNRNAKKVIDLNLQVMEYVNILGQPTIVIRIGAAIVPLT